MAKQGDLFIVRTSERGDWMRCRQMWKWGYVDRLKPNNEPVYFRFGTMIHSALDGYFKPQKITTAKRSGVRRGTHPAKTFAKIYDEQEATFNIKADDEWEEGRALGVEMLNNYVENYGADERWVCVQTEHPFQVDIYDENEKYVCTYAGQLDKVMYDLANGVYVIWDHKTAGTINTTAYNFDEQANSYWAMAPYVFQTLGIEQQLDAIMFDILRKAKKDNRPVNELGQSLNKDGTVSKIQPAPLFHRHIVFRGQEEAHAVMRRIVEQAREMRKAEEGKFPIYKSPLKGCTGMYGCQFRDMCELHEQGNDWESLRDGMFHVWEPYAAHEIQNEKG